MYAALPAPPPWNPAPHRTPTPHAYLPTPMQSSVNSEFEFAFDFLTSRDFYHMAPGLYSFCGVGAWSADNDCTVGLDPNVNSGWVYLTVTSLKSDYSDANIAFRGELTFEVVPPTLSYIRPEQLAALRDLYDGNCRPTQQQLPIFDLTLPRGDVNRHWTRRNHMRGAYAVGSPDPNYAHLRVFNTSGDERNVDTVPFCDWLFSSRIESASAPLRDTPPGLAGSGDCEKIDYVTCNEVGYVVELDLSALALSGPLPPSFSVFTHLERLYLHDNQLTGELPAALFGSKSLRSVQVSHNFFEGPLPCPTHPQPALERVSASQNHFTGGLPDCIFTAAPRLRILHLDYVDLGGTIPDAIAGATQLAELHLEHAGLTGSLPHAMRCLTKLESLSLARNALSGPVPQPVVDGMTNLRELKLSFNAFSGAIPSIPVSHTQFRHLLLDHNAFSGDFARQLQGFAANLAAGGDTYSTISLDHNDLSGRIPDVVYGMIHNARGMGAGSAPTSWHLSMIENHLLCAPGLSREWPAWVLRTGSDFFGQCTPVARPTRLRAAGNGMASDGIAVVMLGGAEATLLTVEGDDFEASAELKCKLTPVGGASPEPVVVGAFYENSSSLRCPLPAETPVGNYTLSVANYGDDYYSAETAGAEHYSPLPVHVVRDGGSSGLGVLTPAEIVGAVIGALVGLVLIVCLVCALCVIIAREKRGTPLFAEMPSTVEGGRARRPSLLHSPSSMMPPGELQMHVSIDPNA